MSNTLIAKPVVKRFGFIKALFLLFMALSSTAFAEPAQSAFFTGVANGETDIGLILVAEDEISITIAISTPTVVIVPDANDVPSGVQLVTTGTLTDQAFSDTNFASIWRWL